jgi:hypothetical protein
MGYDPNGKTQAPITKIFISNLSLFEHLQFELAKKYENPSASLYA